MPATHDDYLFPDLYAPRHVQGGRRRNLFLPALLSGGGGDNRLAGKDRDNAYAIFVKWANLESSGKLHGRKESSIEAEFLKEVFGDALGYRFLSAAEDEWDIEPQYFAGVGKADAAIGVFRQGAKGAPRAVIELKGPAVNLDRDRSQGRTPIQQCWDYLNALPKCPWGIVSNIVSFRLYHRDRTPLTYELFTLQELKRPERFNEFYYVFQREGVLASATGQRPRADSLLDDTEKQQRQVGDQLYVRYSANREALIRHLCGPPHGKSLDEAIHVAQKLVDRIVFVAFCEDRGLLPPRTLDKAYKTIQPFSRVTNPRWQNFLNLFGTVDAGNERERISPFNGGLFRRDPDVDDLQLDDEWTDFFQEIGGYDFRDTVNVDVLGHLFERSVNDIERIRRSGFFESGLPDETRPHMEKSAERKRFGIYYTPVEFTMRIARETIQNCLDDRFRRIAERLGVKPEDFKDSEPDPAQARYWNACLDSLRDLKIVDPACGSGAFLIQAYDFLEELYEGVIDHLVFHDGEKRRKLRESVPDFILNGNVHGVDLSPEAVEITQLALWIRSAHEGKSLADLSHNIVCGNSLIEDEAVDARAMRWERAFPAVFERENPGFDCVIGNPPWERMKLQEREFFDVARPDIAAAVNAAARRRRIAELEEKDPTLHARYLAAKEKAERMLGSVRSSGRYPLSGRGDINTYAVFVELARRLVAPDGRVGLLVPSGIATDHTTRRLFGELTKSKALIALYDFENRKKIFPDVDGRFKFSILFFGGSRITCEEADFVFFAHAMRELEEKTRHIPLSDADFKLMNPNTRTCPVFRTRRDAALTRAIYRRVPVLVRRERKETGNPWGVQFVRMFDQTNDAELFKTAEDLKSKNYRREGALWLRGDKRFLPLYEAKMIQAYDHRAAGVIVQKANWMRQGQTQPTVLVQHQDPEFVVEPRWWVEEKHVDDRLQTSSDGCRIAYKDVTSPTNMRTMIAAFIPKAGVMNSAPLIITGEAISKKRECCLLANPNSFAMDFVARQKVGGLHLNFFIVEQLPIFAPDAYAEMCPWEREVTLEDWIGERVLKLTCTADDMKPLASAAKFDPPVHKWKPEERAELEAELDAAYFLLYGLSRDDAEYILNTFSGVRSKARGTLSGEGIAERILRHCDDLTSRIG